MSWRTDPLLLASVWLLPAFAVAQGDATEAEPEVVPPKLAKFVEAPYPPGALEEGREGDVVMLLTIDEAGEITDVAVVESAGADFDEAATEAAFQFEFEPATVDGEPTPVQIRYRYTFELGEEVVEKPAEIETGVLTGVVLQRGTRTPLAGLVVRLEGTDFETATDAKGEFEFVGVPAGKVAIAVDDPEFYTLVDEEEVRAGEATELKYYLERRGSADDTLVVVGRRPQKEVVRRTLTVEEIRKLPGTSGDALKVVQNLPGVARAPFGGGQLVIRGSNPGDSGAVVERHFVPLAFHFGGLRAIFPTEIIDAIDFYPGNFAAEYGRFGGGIVDVQLKRPRDDRLHGRVELNVFDAGFSVEGPSWEGGSFLVAMRRSYIDAILPAVLPDDAGIDFTVAPRYYDLHALYDWRGDGHELLLYFFYSDDTITFVLDEPAGADPTIRGDFRNTTAFHRTLVRWKAQLTDELKNDFSVSFGENKIFFGVAGQEFLFDLDVWVVFAREDIELTLSDTLTLRTGVDVEGTFGQIEVEAPIPPKEGDTNDQTPIGSRETRRIDQSVGLFDPAIWAELQIKPVKALLLVPSVRFDYHSPVQDYSIDPRFNARWTVADGTVLKGGVGLYMQRPTPDETDETFGNSDLELERSLHASLGFEQRIVDGLSFDVVGFYKKLWNSVTASDDTDEIYDNSGEGRIYGGEFLLRRDLADGFFGWISYTLMRSERKDGSGEDYRPFDFDQTHILTVLGQYKITNEWEFGLRWRYVTGNPYTPFDGGIYDVDIDAWVPIAGETNSERNPPFHQLDVRVDRNWIYDTWILTAYLELQNVYNRQNPEGRIYNEDYTESDTLVGIPIIPSFGIKGEF